MAIKAGSVVNARRTVKAALTFEAQAERTTADLRVLYRGISLRLAREFEQATDEDKAAVVAQIARIVVGLPDILGEDEKPVEPSSEFFEALDIENLRAISDAIGNDINPPTKPSAA